MTILAIVCYSLAAVVTMIVLMRIDGESAIPVLAFIFGLIWPVVVLGQALEWALRVLTEASRKVWP